ncbi:MAG: nucleotidyl transferase AbiEii/AbiGii toxin family protein [Thiolinea sp.]
MHEHHIYFGGGTRICLELDEYRESVDIDFLCPDRKAYIAVRETLNSASLGQLVNQDFSYLREIRADRYGEELTGQQSQPEKRQGRVLQAVLRPAGQSLPPDGLIKAEKRDT